jgi:succinylglutamate desuccinylase
MVDEMIYINLISTIKLGISVRGGASMIPLSNSEKDIAIVAGYDGKETANGHIYNIESGKWADKLLSSDELNW